MNDAIRFIAPLALALSLGVVGVVAVMISKGATILAANDFKDRRKIALGALVSALPGNLCRSAFSYDIWVVTTLFAGDKATLTFYNLTAKYSAIVLLLVLHLVLFLFVACWGGLVRRDDTTEQAALELWCAVGAIVLCIVFQVY